MDRQTDRIAISVSRISTLTDFLKKTKQSWAIVSINDQYEVLHGLVKKVRTHYWTPKIQDGRNLKKSFLPITQQPIARLQWNFAWGLGKQFLTECRQWNSYRVPQKVFLVFLMQLLWASANGRFRIVSDSLVSKTIRDTRYGDRYDRKRKRTHVRSIQWCHFQWSWNDLKWLRNFSSFMKWTVIAYAQ